MSEARGRSTADTETPASGVKPESPQKDAVPGRRSVKIKGRVVKLEPESPEPETNEESESRDSDCIFVGEVPAPDVQETQDPVRSGHQLQTEDTDGDDLLDYSYSPEESSDEVDEAAEEDVEEVRGLAADAEDEEAEEEDSSDRGNTEEDVTLRRNTRFAVKLSQKPKDVPEADFVEQLAEEAAKTGWEGSPSTTSALLEQSGLQHLKILWEPKHPRQGPDEILEIVQGRCPTSSAISAGAGVSILTAPTAPAGLTAPPSSSGSQPEPTVPAKRIREEPPATTLWEPLSRRSVSAGNSVSSSSRISSRTSSGIDHISGGETAPREGDHHLLRQRGSPQRRVQATCTDSV